MAKGDDAVRKKKNKANRKKLSKDTATVSSRIAALIATKKRRKTGKRRMCEGMCFSLPTLEDPYNDKGTRSNKKKKAKKVVTIGPLTIKEKTKIARKNGSLPSKYLIQCLNTIEYSLRHDGLEKGDDRFFTDNWGMNFWKCYKNGRGILDTSGSCSSLQQIAWIVSTASDVVESQETEDPSVSGPILLYLVPTREAAAKVRSICTPLKKLGIHAVCLHTGADLDHQIQGLKSVEPEFLLATPDRLLELVSLKVIDISAVSFLVVDGLHALCNGGYLDAIKSIRKGISGSPMTIVFDDLTDHSSIHGVQDLLAGSVSRVCVNDSIYCQSAYISQAVHVCSSQERKIMKGIQILQQACGKRSSIQPSKVLFVVSNSSQLQPIVNSIESSGYSVSMHPITNNIEKRKSAQPTISVIEMKQIHKFDMEEYELVIIVDITQSIHNYVKILTNMAKLTINGALHSLLSNEDLSMAKPLIQVLQECKRAVPKALTKLCYSASTMVED